MEDKSTILIVEDEATNIDFIIKSLNDEYQFKIAQDGDIALEILKKFEIDLILLDIKMPRVSGYEVAKEIKKDEKLSPIPFIFLTASGNQDELVYGFELGAKDYITKPFNKKELEVRVKNHLTTYLQQKKIIEQQDMLIQQSKFTAMGEMTAMLAHQWRQPLNVVSVLVQEMGFKRATNRLDEESFSEISKKILKTLNHMSSTIDDFKDYFKPSKEKKVFDINDAIKSCLVILQTRFDKRDISYSLKKHDCENGKLKYNGYEGQFKQVIVNILNNSIDALDKYKFTNTEKSIEILIKCCDEFVEINIEDSAGGIENDILDKIFEPYFSTKDEKNGTGLGLYMSKTIIEKSFAGTIKASNTKSGAIFTIKI